MVEQKEWNVSFLVDNNPPDKIVLLQRASDKSFAPDFYTGIGGKVDLGETILQSAYRELKEETGIKDIELTEFARCVYDSGLKLYYFWGEYVGDTLPHVDPAEGTIVWVSTEEFLQKDFIPTTQVVCEEWAKRGFQTDKPFTVYVREVGKEQTVRLVEVQSVADGLQ